MMKYFVYGMKQSDSEVTVADGEILYSRQLLELSMVRKPKIHPKLLLILLCVSGLNALVF